jgi:hypothetical protein
MIESDLERLVRRDGISLDRLETDIWMREGEFLADYKSSRRILGWQAGVLALAVAISASLGTLEASHLRGAEIALTNSDLAPASLLLGSRE